MLPFFLTNGSRAFEGGDTLILLKIRTAGTITDGTNEQSPVDNHVDPGFWCQDLPDLPSFTLAGFSLQSPFKGPRTNLER